VSRLVQGFHQAQEAIEAERQVARAILAAGEGEAPVLRGGATAGGDRRRLRGLPAIGRGVSGAIPGTNPSAPCSVRRTVRVGAEVHLLNASATTSAGTQRRSAAASVARASLPRRSERRRGQDTVLAVAERVQLLALNVVVQ
jgi:hypothetical protein